MNKQIYCILNIVFLNATMLDAYSTSTPIGSLSQPSQSAVKLELIHRIQSYNHKPRAPGDIFDPDIQSPKSVRFSREGDRVFVNSLEGMKTVVYKTDTFEKTGVVLHTFHAHDQALFDKVSPKNLFSGKPVESALTHNGKYLWVPYYRRDFDQRAVEPSAVAVIDTHTLKIERVFATGPISKYVFPSPDGKLLVVSNWGNNTLSILDIAHENARDFHLMTTLTVERELDLKKVTGNRDNNCGLCLRGLAFTNDSRYLFVARMGGGGIAVFDMKDRKGAFTYLGSVFGMKPTPRDLLLAPDGNSLYVSSNVAGYVSRVDISSLVEKAKNALGKHISMSFNDEVEVGSGARTIRLSQDGRYLFVALNNKSEVAVVDTLTFRVISRIPVDAYPVGLDLSPDGHQLWVTSQAKDTGGVNAVNVFLVNYEPHGS